MKVIFFGSSEISVPFLEELYKSKHEVTLVVTKTDKQSGRGRKVIPNIVKSRARELGISFIQVGEFDNSFYDDFGKLEFDAAVMVSFGRIIPARLINSKVARWLNVHPSLLPKYRGPTPIISAVLNGDSLGGVSVIEVTAEVDRGGIYAQVKFGIGESDNREIYERKVIKFGSPVLLTVLDLLESGDINSYPQEEENATYTRKTKNEDFRIDWRQDAVRINNKIRAFSSSPGAYCFWKSLRIKILKAEVPDEFESKEYLSGLKINEKSINNGYIVRADKNSGILVKCGGSQIIKIKLLKPQGKRVMTDRDFINGYLITAGESFE
ncbi:MAG: methionyl-tRNA formyltransferase [Actinomycetota bacterium]|nr:methionyl-tRNA formyltransferase [Actinomycetota bacterium]